MLVEIKEIWPGRRKSCIFLLFDQSSGRVLIEKRRAKSPNDKMTGMLIIPAGKVEEVDRVPNGDYFENALMREVSEEFGVVVTAKTVLFDIMHTTPNGNTYDSRVYLVHGWQGNVLNVEGRNEHLWLDIQEAERLVSNPVEKRAIRAARKEWMI